MVSHDLCFICYKSEHQMAYTEILNSIAAKDIQHCSDTQVMPSKEHWTCIRQQHKVNGNKTVIGKRSSTHWQQKNENSGVGETAQNILLLQKTVFSAHHPCQEAYNHQLTQAPSGFSRHLHLCSHTPLQPHKKKKSKAFYLSIYCVYAHVPHHTQRSKASVLLLACRLYQELNLDRKAWWKRPVLTVPVSQTAQVRIKDNHIQIKMKP